MRTIYKTLYNFCGKRAHLFLALFIVSQPLIGIAEFWTFEASYSQVVTVVRAVVLLLFFVTGFILSSKKRVYYYFVSIFVLFWAVRLMILYASGGVSDIYYDTVMYYRAASVFLVMIPAVTLLQYVKLGVRILLKSISVVFIIIVATVILAYLTGTGYTYGAAQIGFMGWVGVHNGYGVILLISLAMTQLFFYLKSLVLMYVIVSILGYVLMFAVGTRVTFYSLFVLAFVWIGTLFVVRMKKNNMNYLIPHLLGAALALLLISYSPMTQRQEQLRSFFDKVAVDGDGSAYEGVYKSEVASPKITAEKRLAGGSDSVEKDKIKKNYETHAPELVDRFGFESVYFAFDRIADMSVVGDNREQKNVYGRLLMQQGSTGQWITGHEASEMKHNKRIFHPEADAVSILTYYGILGSILFWSFLSGPVLFICLRVSMINPRVLLDPLIIVTAATASLTIVAGVVSGTTLLTQSTAVYIGLVIALLYSVSHEKLSNNRRGIYRGR